VIFSNQKKISVQKDIKGGRSDSKSLSNFKEKMTAVMTDPSCITDENGRGQVNTCNVEVIVVQELVPHPETGLSRRISRVDGVTQKVCRTSRKR
jgi:hypothetical protein